MIDQLKRKQAMVQVSCVFNSGLQCLHPFRYINSRPEEMAILAMHEIFLKIACGTNAKICCFRNV